MTYQSSDFQRIIRELQAILEEDINKTGIFYRTYFRIKSSKSLSKKLEGKNDNGSPKYDGQTKLIRDLLGIRINLYFVDDLEILIDYFKTRFENSFLEEAVDVNTDTEFKPTRVNLIFRLPEEIIKEYKDIQKDERIDTTFELQLRTIFSEGWHEVEHDFRYKCLDDWKSYSSLSRTFNGILAALETHEWSIIKMFEELSYRHFKTGNLSAMIRMQLRVRTDTIDLSEELEQLIRKETNFMKALYKLERNKIVNFLLTKKLSIPLSVDNLVYLINFFFIKNRKIVLQTPGLLLSQFKEIH
jgi:putative GTP pyrophosphokinase